MRDEKLRTLATAAIDAALARPYVAVSTDGVTLDHVAIEAVFTVAGLLGPETTSPEAAVSGLRIVLELLRELPAVSGHQAFQDAFRSRFRAVAR